MVLYRFSNALDGRFSGRFWGEGMKSGLLLAITDLFIIYDDNK